MDSRSVCECIGVLDVLIGRNQEAIAGGRCRARALQDVSRWITSALRKFDRCSQVIALAAVGTAPTHHALLSHRDFSARASRELRGPLGVDGFVRLNFGYFRVFKTTSERSSSQVLNLSLIARAARLNFTLKVFAACATRAEILFPSRIPARCGPRFAASRKDAEEVAARLCFRDGKPREEARECLGPKRDGLTGLSVVPARGPVIIARSTPQ